MRLAGVLVVLVLMFAKIANAQVPDPKPPAPESAVVPAKPAPISDKDRAELFRARAKIAQMSLEFQQLNLRMEKLREDFAPIKKAHDDLLNNLQGATKTWVLDEDLNWQPRRESQTAAAQPPPPANGGK